MAHTQKSPRTPPHPKEKVQHEPVHAHHVQRANTPTDHLALVQRMHGRDHVHGVWRHYDDFGHLHIEFIGTLDDEPVEEPLP